MAQIIKDKWFNIVKKDAAEEAPLDQFYNFQHTSPYIFFMIERINDMIQKQRKHQKESNLPAQLVDPFLEDTIELITKICIIFQVFTHNKINQVQI